MKVYAENHHSAALLYELESGEKNTMLVQSESDQEIMLGKEWEEGEYTISDEYLPYFATGNERIR